LQSVRTGPVRRNGRHHSLWCRCRRNRMRAAGRCPVPARLEKGGFMFRRIANSLFLLGLVPWVGVFVLSVMLFDAPGAESSPLTQGVFYSVAAYPVLVIVGFFSSNGFWRMRDERHWRRHLALLPL